MTRPDLDAAELSEKPWPPPPGTLRVPDAHVVESGPCTCDDCADAREETQDAPRGAR